MFFTIYRSVLQSSLLIGLVREFSDESVYRIIVDKTLTSFLSCFREVSCLEVAFVHEFVSSGFSDSKIEFHVFDGDPGWSAILGLRGGIVSVHGFN